MKRFFWVSLFTAVLTGFYGCSQNDFIENSTDNQKGDSEETAWFAIWLQDTEASTRSFLAEEYDDYYENREWFNKGTEDERAVIDNPESNRVLFFNSDNSFYGSAQLEKPATAPENVYVGHKPAGTADVLPAKALVVMNGDPARLNTLEAELQAAGTGAIKKALTHLNSSTAESYDEIAQYKGYFTMTSSVYANESNAMTAVTELNNPEFYDTVAEAIQPANLLVFHVERILAKVTIRFKEGMIEGQEGSVKFGTDGPIILKGASELGYDDDYNGTEIKKSGWSINMVNWGMNALERNTYLFKSLAQAPAAYPWLADANFYNGWTSPFQFRSYWGIDENYNEWIYPDQYRVALDADLTSATANTIYSDNYASAGLGQKDLPLIYKSYDSFAKYSTRADDKYTVENTFDETIFEGQDLTGKPFLRSGTHIIIAAQLIIDALDKDINMANVDENGFLTDVTDKYFSNNFYWSEEALLQQEVATLLANLNYDGNENGQGEKVNNVKNIFTGVLIDLINDPESAHYDEEADIQLLINGTAVTTDNATDFFEFAPAFIKGGDGWVTLHLKDKINGEKPLVQALYKDGSKIDISNEQLVSYIYHFTNLAKHYAQGRMYYALPIRHNLNSLNFLTNTGEVSTGDYGVVRNHWYRLTINSIFSPGTPVDDPAQPIIPNNEPDEKSLGIEVEVLSWEEVPIGVNYLQ